MHVHFSHIPGDKFTAFAFVCTSCTKGGRCTARIQLQKSLLFGSLIIPDCLHIDPETCDIGCDDFRESGRKTKKELRKERYLKRKKISEEKGQLRLF